MFALWVVLLKNVVNDTKFSHFQFFFLVKVWNVSDFFSAHCVLLFNFFSLWWKFNFSFSFWVSGFSPGFTDNLSIFPFFYIHSLLSKSIICVIEKWKWKAQGNVQGEKLGFPFFSFRFFLLLVVSAVSVKMWVFLGDLECFSLEQLFPSFLLNFLLVFDLFCLILNLLKKKNPAKFIKYFINGIRTQEFLAIAISLCFDYKLFCCWFSSKLA